MISQAIEVMPWPLVETGNEKFFGYPVAIGVHQLDPAGDSWFYYADFAYNGNVTRYRMPHHESLLHQLRDALDSNLISVASDGDLCHKVWITRGVNGYVVDMP